MQTRLTRALVLVVAFVAIHVRAVEQSVSLSNGVVLELNGLGEARQLRSPLFIGALYVELRASDPKVLLANAASQRMLFRFETRISRHQWLRLWREYLPINATRADIQKHTLNVQAFLGLFKGALKRGDELVIDSESAQRTRVTLNGIQLGIFDDGTFYALLAHVWLGPRPLNEDFQKGVLGILEHKQVEQHFDALVPPAGRLAQVKRWAIRQQLENALGGARSETVATAASAAAAQERSKPQVVLRHVAATARKPQKTGVKKRPTVSSLRSTHRLAARQQTKRVKPGVATVSSATRKRPGKPKVVAPIASSTTAKIKFALKPQLSKLNPEQILALREGYEEEVADRILEKKVYPFQKMKRRYKKRSSLAQKNVVVVVKLVLNRQGKLLSKTLLRSSGEKVLDHAALSLVEHSTNLPAFPVLLQASQLTLSVSVPYRIR